MAKDVDEDDIEDRIAREFVRLLPKLPSTLNRLIKKAQRFDYREPTTFLSEINSEMERCVPTLSEADVDTLRGLAGLLSDLLLKQEARQQLKRIVRMTKSEAAKDPRYSLLLRLMSEADKRVPLISMIVSKRHADPIEALGPQCAPYDLLEQAERVRGEVRATVVLRALGETAEALYRPYLTTIWLLSFFKEGEMPPPQIPEFGNLVKEAYNRLADYPGLVEPNAVWMRNSAIHNPRKYMVTEDAIEMWDKRVEPRLVPISELHAMVKRMYQISGVTIQRVAQLYMFRNLFGKTGLLDEMINCFPKFLALDKQAMLLAEASMSTKAQEMLRPMAEFFEKHTPSAV